MNDANQEKLIAMIDKLASKLGIAADHLWTVLARQAYVEGWVTICATVVITVLCVVSWRKTWKYTIDPAAYDTKVFDANTRSERIQLNCKTPEEVAFVTIAFTVVTSLFFLIFWFLTIFGGISSIINPEYHDLDKIVSQAAKL